MLNSFYYNVLGGIMKNEEVNLTLKNLRKAYGYTYQEMSNKLHICKAYYWQIEHKNRRLSYALAKEIAAIFSKRPDDIFYNETK